MKYIITDALTVNFLCVNPNSNEVFAVFKRRLNLGWDIDFTG
jgi:hypothetical protein